MNTIKLYLRSMKMLLRCQAEYPVSFVLNTLSQLVMMGGEMMAVLLLFNRFSRLGQWTGGNILFFFGLLTITFYLVECFARGVANFSPVVRTGALDTMLLRPQGVLTQVLCYAVDPRRAGAIAVGIVAAVMGANQSQIHWTMLKWAAFFESILCGCFLITGLFLIEALFCFRSIQSVEVVNVLTYGGRSTCQYPIDIYPTPLRVVFTCVAPFALTTHLPASYILDKSLFGWPEWTVFAAPLSGILFFALMYLLFRRGLKGYRSTGS